MRLIKPFARQSLLLATAAVLLGTLPGCINPVYDSQKVSKLDYQHIAPVSVSTGHVDIVNHFHPTAASDKAASVFPTRPENALNHYAENRLKANGYEGTLQFIIEEATVVQSVVLPDSTVQKWAGTGVQDRYDITLRVTLARQGGDGNSQGSANINLKRFITVPKGYSIAKRDATLREFTQKMIEEVDGMVVTALQDRMHMLAGGTAAMPATMHSDNDGTVTAPPAATSEGPAVPSMPVQSVHPEALPPPW